MDRMRSDVSVRVAATRTVVLRPRNRFCFASGPSGLSIKVRRSSMGDNSLLLETLDSPSLDSARSRSPPLRIPMLRAPTGCCLMSLIVSPFVSMSAVALFIRFCLSQFRCFWRFSLSESRMLPRSSLMGVNALAAAAAVGPAEGRITSVHSSSSFSSLMGWIAHARSVALHDATNMAESMSLSRSVLAVRELSATQASATSFVES
mmetsp:Transcript_24149/g.75525  ORF Transcript_24149/g.75525 Transcript_24149/m.75525 type:complete len:205 (+) Transcript_24149:941-1555(+)